MRCTVSVVLGLVHEAGWKLLQRAEWPGFLRGSESSSSVSITMALQCTPLEGAYSWGQRRWSMLVWAVTLEGGCRASRKQAGACLLSGKCTSGHRCTGAQAAVEGGSRPTAPEPAVVAVVPSSAMSSAATAGEAGICGRQLACISDGAPPPPPPLMCPK